MKNSGPLVVGFSLGIGVLTPIILIADREANRSPHIDIFWQMNSAEKISLDDIANVYVASGAILSNPENREMIRKALNENRMCEPRPFSDYTRGMTAEYYKRRERYLLGLAEHLSKSDYKASDIRAVRAR